MDMTVRSAVRPGADSFGHLFHTNRTSRVSSCPPEGSRPLVADRRESRIDQARSIIVVHLPSADGWCVGCADLGRYALAPCPTMKLALSVVETHGIAVWDARPSEGKELRSLPPRDACETHSPVRMVV